ncbi:MAG: Uma2 family endonuclease [Microcoleus sp. PH2017_25_DOB_D_A]|uniref:Uma2 family endonuclease n=1 Tax=unclassified Microcoleus TaxID=2642155 RepID=UPI001D7D8033|nr:MULTISPECIES: Uma2 family endonuclease [unclassified Microcoleus]TAE43534.1 MAG: Uma2 family endonuclease [Oscillatoriales cyanobacterium]MCC3447008.1 Uma2 family endonuclease [Microcoleus sp. PH2017_09_SFU_O_A]MCC3491415.1 Uma2 family endonuclease [Microcoleus sp. PH2017_16_JOR_D_A]MCC3496959.1 Uma2 family endonuclease [Microcoleus sp. PH2017_15_JOR_U_A]MCC3536446.1 Uma2 family endonuclease [Microcoleus sp. PH2017_25_DOB_D_A]
MTLLDLRLLTVQEYDRMTEIGIFDEDERVELLAGQIVKMAAKGTAHGAAVKRTEKLLENRLGERVLVRLQDPVRLDNYSEPEPDISVVIPDPLYYEDHHPTPSEIYLIVEVADTTLRTDCGIKAKIYAESGIADYWVLDVNNRQLHVFREPSQDGYQSIAVLGDDASISPLQFPDVSFMVRDMLRPLVTN